MAFTSGTKLGPYEILSPLGAGGMGEVYRARDSRLGREVALKVLPESFSRDSERLRRFEQEARAVAALNHPNILAIHGVGMGAIRERSLVLKCGIGRAVLRASCQLVRQGADGLLRDGLDAHPRYRAIRPRPAFYGRTPGNHSAVRTRINRGARFELAG